MTAARRLTAARWRFTAEAARDRLGARWRACCGSTRGSSPTGDSSRYRCARHVEPSYFESGSRLTMRMMRKGR